MKKYAIRTALAAFMAAALLFDGQAFAVADRPATDSPSAGIPTVMVEMPHEALKAWTEAGLKNATLLFIGSDPGFSPIPDEILPQVDELMSKRDWDGLLARDYPTPGTYPIQPYNFLAAAHRAGLIGKVYWVPPSKKPVGSEDFAAFSGYLRDSGIPDSEVDALVPSDYSIQGNLNGIPFYICSIKDLPKLGGDVTILVDLSFFSGTYENEVKDPFLDMFGGFAEVLGRRVPGITSAVVSNSTMMDQVPLSMRFAGGYLYKWFTSPDHLKSGPPRQWELRSQAMYYDCFYQTEEALDAYIDAVKLAPDDASLHFDLARALDRMKELDPLKDEIDAAVRLDPGYYPQYLAFARTFLDNKVPWAAEVCVKDAIKVNPDDPRNYDALREVYDSTMMYDKAADCVEKVIGMGFELPGNYGLLGLTYTKAGSYPKAVAAFEKAISLVREDNRAAMAAFQQGLADAYAGDKKIEKALDTYRLAMDNTDDQHEKMLIYQKAEALRLLWAPFLGGGPVTAPEETKP